MDPRAPGLIDEGPFPVEYLDRSPPLAWHDPGAHVVTYVVLLEDLDASPVRVHWCLFDLPEKLRGLPGAIPPVPEVHGGRHAVNDLGHLGYSGPLDAPVTGQRFALRIYALDTKLGLPPGTPARTVIHRMQNHVVQLASRVAFLEREEGFVRRAAA
jgi:Raf kinase inhibitor-like YbhB/YbcL family protein